MAQPLHRDDLGPEFVHTHLIGRQALKALLLSESGRSERLSVRIDCLPPHTAGTKYHSHSCQEEFFFVLQGHPTVRLDRQRHQLRPGSFFAKPPGKGIAHQFFNETDAPCEILDISLRDPNDICIFPDEGVAVVQSLQKVFSLESGIKGWSSTETHKPAGTE